jgi:hypothetical protein
MLRSTSAVRRHPARSLARCSPEQRKCAVQGAAALAAPSSRGGRSPPRAAALHPCDAPTVWRTTRRAAGAPEGSAMFQTTLFGPITVRDLAATARDTEPAARNAPVSLWQRAAEPTGRTALEQEPHAERAHAAPRACRAPRRPGGWSRGIRGARHRPCRPRGSARRTRRQAGRAGRRGAPTRTAGRSPPRVRAGALHVVSCFGCFAPVS